VGGILRLTVWCTAIQSAAGFSSVTALPLIFLAREYAPGYFTELYFNGALNLWYLTIIFPTIGADLAITIESWVAAYRDASLLKLSNAAWKTFVQIHNTATAIDNMGGAFSAVRDAFDPASNVSSGEDSDSKTAAAVGLTVMLVIVSIALAGGCLNAISHISYRPETGSKGGTTSSRIDYSNAQPVGRRAAGRRRPSGAKHGLYAEPTQRACVRSQAPAGSTL
jgi:hypothetical protein